LRQARSSRPTPNAIRAAAIFDLRRKPFDEFSGCGRLRCRNDWLNGLGFMIGLYLNNLFPKTEIRATNLSSAYRTRETPNVETRMEQKGATRWGAVSRPLFLFESTPNPLKRLDSKK
jgi:hypothetical protein